MLISFVASRSVVLLLTALILAYLRVVYYKFTMLLVTNPPPWTGNFSKNRGLLGLSTRKFIQYVDFISFFYSKPYSSLLQRKVFGARLFLHFMNLGFWYSFLGSIKCICDLFRTANLTLLASLHPKQSLFEVLHSVIPLSNPSWRNSRTSLTNWRLNAFCTPYLNNKFYKNQRVNLIAPHSLCFFNPQKHYI